MAETPHAAPDQGEELVAALHAAFGVHRVRALHARGVMVQGGVQPTEEARGLSVAALFAPPKVRATIRFSNFAASPTVADTAAGARPHGLAIKFHLPSGGETDVVAHSFDGFPVASAAAFGDLLRAIAASRGAATPPTPLDRYLDAHPAAKRFLTGQKPAPRSFATLTYFGVNSFWLVDARGGRIAVRYRFVPQAGEQFLDAGALAAAAPSYLCDEIVARLAREPVVFDWLAQVAEPGDDVGDPSLVWPDARRLVRLGTLAIVRPLFDQPLTDRATSFRPGRLLRGIEPGDAMIAARDAAYAVSVRERQ